MAVVLPEQNQSARPCQEFDERLQCLLFEAEAAKVKAAVAGIENANDDFFSAHGWKNGDAEFDAAEFGVGRGVAFLRQIGLIGNQAGHDFDATGDFLHEVERQVDQFIEHPVEADAHHERAFPRLDVNVAGADFDGVNEQVIDQRADFNGLLVGDRLQITSRLVHRVSLVFFGESTFDMLMTFLFMTSGKFDKARQ